MNLRLEEKVDLSTRASAVSTMSRLDSWKEIAVHLNRTVRTAQRWETREGLPVHRHFHRKASTVCAFREEIDAWLVHRRRGPRRLLANGEHRESV